MKPAHLSSGIELDILPHLGLSCLPNVGLYTLLVRSWFSLLTCFVDRFSVSNLCNLPAVMFASAQQVARGAPLTAISVVKDFYPLRWK